ncbi:hypothetical protein BpsM61_00038 [Bacillus phage vB_BpsM-61]|nr:hypothetical protein BpsM61_00038 [Bacillus phage vB_BpsM-61]
MSGWSTFTNRHAYISNFTGTVRNSAGTVMANIVKGQVAYAYQQNQGGDVAFWIYDRTTSSWRSFHLPRITTHVYGANWSHCFRHITHFNCGLYNMCHSGGSRYNTRYRPYLRNSDNSAYTGANSNVPASAQIVFASGQGWSPGQNTSRHHLLRINGWVDGGTFRETFGAFVVFQPTQAISQYVINTL